MSYSAELGIINVTDPAQFKALAGGKVWFGVPDGSPATVPGDRIQIYLARQGLSDLAIAQPLDIGPGGQIMYSGQPAQINVLVPYCVQIMNSLGVQKYYTPKSNGYIEKFIEIDAYNADQDTEIGKKIKFQTVADYSSLLALDPSEFNIGDRVFVTNTGTQGEFIVRSGSNIDDGGVIKTNSIWNSSNKHFKRYINTPVNLTWFEAVADYNTSTYAGTDNTTAIQKFLNYLASSGATGEFYGNYKFVSALSINGASTPVKIVCKNNQQCGWYCTGTNIDALTFLNCFGVVLEGFGLVGGYSTATAVTNKGLVLRQTGYTKTKDLIVANFRDNMHHDGGYLHRHEGMISSNYRRSPLWYSYSEYGDTPIGMAHNEYIDPVFAHEYGGAGRGVYITHGELMLQNPRGEDYGQKFLNIASTGATLKNVIINSPTTNSDASGVIGTALSIDGAAGAVRSVYVNNPDFLSDDTFNVVDISGNGVEGVYLNGGSIKEGDHGVSVTSSARRVYIFPELIEGAQRNGIYCASGGDSNFFGPKTMRSNNEGGTLAGDALAHIYLDTSANAHVIGTRFEDAANGILYGVSSSIGSTSNSTSNISTTSTSLVLRNDVQDTNVLTGSKTFDWPNIAAGDTSTTTVTVPFALTSQNKVSAYMNIALQGIILSAYVSAVDTVTVTATNATSGAINLASGTLSVEVLKV
jgi:hypothetical protein